MSVLSQRLKVIKPSPTIAMAKKARDLVDQGKAIISLALGESDLPTPPWICEAAIKAIHQGQTRYTPIDGIPALKDAIIGKFARENNLTFSRDQIIVSVGAKQSIYNALIATLNPGDEVIIPAPYWVSYLDIVLLGEGHPIVVACGEEDNFKLTAESLERHITPKTKWVMLNSPNNPAGYIYSREDLARLGEVLEKYPQIYILTDDIYEHLRYDGQPFVTFAEACPGLAERTLTINGVSKAYAMTGWRIGYAAGPREVIRAMDMLQSQSTSCPCSISQAAAVAALTGPQDFILDQQRIFRERRDSVVATINNIEGLSCETPQGAFYVYVNCEDLISKTTPGGLTFTNDTELATYFLEEAQVAVVPGEAFGLSPYFRLSYALNNESLMTACERLQKAVEALR